MIKKNILVTGASGIIGYGILKSLKNCGYNLIGTTIYENSIAPYFSDLVEIVPNTNHESYIKSLIAIIKKHQVDMVIPGIEIDVMKLAEHQDIIKKETGVTILLNNPELIKLCSDKWLFYQKLQDFKSPYAIPTSVEVSDEIKFPIILKPRKGSSSKGIVIVRDLQTLEQFRDKIGSNLMIQPLIGKDSEEYTVSGFFDENSNLHGHICLRRTLSSEGFTQTAEVIDIENIEKIITDISNIFKPIGPTNFQFRIENDKFKLLEINPRISSSTSIRTAFGYNESLMSVKYFLEKVLPKDLRLKKGTAIRYTEDVIYYH